MPYFNNYPKTPYRFGNEIFTTKFPNLALYADIKSSIINSSSFYQKYYIKSGDRPDTVSQKLYKNPNYHWTFSMINDNIREQGWPLSVESLNEKISKDFPNTVLTTRADINEKFLVGSVAIGITSGVSGTIIKRRLKYGQIFIEGDVEFIDGETIEVVEDEITNLITIEDKKNEYNAIMHFTNEDGEFFVDPRLGPGNLVTTDSPDETDYYEYSLSDDDPIILTATTFAEYYTTSNESLRSIIVIKPEAIETISRQFIEAMRS